MQYRLLGPLEADDGGRQIALGGARQQAVLASLLLHAEQTASLERLVDELWDETPPETARKTVQVYVSRLRKLLPKGAIERRPGGYVLHLNGDQLDLREFERRAEEGRAALAGGEAERAAELLRQALALWRGPALAGLASEALRREAERLEELRLRTLEERLEADLASGLHRDLVGELQALVAEQPFRQRLRAQLMLALYRSGRTGEALEVYRQTHRLLWDELGLEPSDELRELERAILRTDPTLKLPSPSRSNMPVQLTPLIGRERELAEVLELLGKKRLLTLTGPGGVGKTRLAQQAASEVVDQFRDGAWFVSLAALRAPELVLPTIAQALRVKEPQTLERYLREKQLLLLLDNLEQLLDVAPQLAGLLAQATDLKLLVTSREPLHLAGEQEYPVPPLADEEAERLFLERARAAKPSFRPDDQVAAICRRLDNLPLALELAAARVNVLTIQELLARLERRLPLLTGGPRDRPERQRTLRSTIEWSYELLTRAEKHLFAHLAVFAGGCTLEAAEAVCDADLETLQALVNKSLLRKTADGRFVMLETIHEFGLDLLRSADDADDARQRHAHFYAALLAQRPAEWSPSLLMRVPTPAGGRFRQRVRADVDNVRAAVEWTLGAGDVELALKLLHESHTVPLSARERADWYERALAKAGSLDPAAAADVYRQAAPASFVSGRVAEALAQGERSITLYRELDDLRGEASALLVVGAIYALAGRTEEARDCFTRGLAIAEEHRFDEPLPAVKFIHRLGELERDAGDPARARSLLTQSIELAHAGGQLAAAGEALHGLGDLLLDEGKPGAAEARYAEALAVARDLMAGGSAIYCLGGLAATAAQQGDAKGDAAERSGKLWGAVRALEKREAVLILGLARVRYERALAAVAGPRFDAAVAEGEAMTLDDAIDFALLEAAESPRERQD